MVGVIIDVGHSGKVSGLGAVGTYGEPPKVLYECDLNFVLANLRRLILTTRKEGNGAYRLFSAFILGLTSSMGGEKR